MSAGCTSLRATSVIVEATIDRSRSGFWRARSTVDFGTTSACGVCGKASLEALSLRGLAPVASDTRVDAAIVAGLPARLLAAQGVFEKTGGLHAAGLFDACGDLVIVREDVGRHNAVDKVVGWALLQRALPLDGRILMVSGRTSYEIVQKALVARVPIVCAVSAPSSLAVDLARRFGITLVGFLRGAHFNVYAGEQRIARRQALEVRNLFVLEALAAQYQDHAERRQRREHVGDGEVQRRQIAGDIDPRQDQMTLRTT